MYCIQDKDTYQFLLHALHERYLRNFTKGNVIPTYGGKMETGSGVNFPMEPQPIGCISKNTNQVSQGLPEGFYVFLT